MKLYPPHQGEMIRDLISGQSLSTSKVESCHKSFFCSDIYKCARHLTKWGDLLPDPEDRVRMNRKAVKS